MDYLEERLIENKPQISKSSVRTYKSILKNLYYRHHDADSKINMDWFDDQDIVIGLLADVSFKSRRTIYSALIAISKTNDLYKRRLLDDSHKYSELMKTQTKSETQEANWKEFSEVKTVYDNFYNNIKPLLSRKGELDNHEKSKLVDFMLLAITTGVWFPPRRSQDWILLRVKNYDEKTDNYLDMKNNQFVFNIYKTSKYYDTQKVTFPKEFKSILVKYLKHHDDDFLITNSKHEPFTSQRMVQKLNSLFDGKISTSMLRHIFLTEKLKDVPPLLDLQNLAESMGHQISTALTYVKH